MAANITTKDDSGIYRINLGNGWFYIGSSQHMNVRKAHHLSRLANGKHTNPKMQAIYSKYEIFEFDVLIKCDIDELLVKEQVLLDAFFTDPKCANVNLTVDCVMRGRKHSQATKDKIRYAKLGGKASAETRAKLSAGLTGKKRKPFTAIHKSRISESNKRTRALRLVS